MKIAILDDYHDTLRHLPCFAALCAHQVTIYNDHLQDAAGLAQRLHDIEALVLIRERTKITADVIAGLPKLKLISQRGVYPHVDVQACTEHGVMLCSNLGSDAPSYAAAELTLGLTLAAARQIPQQMHSLQQGQWQIGVGQTLRGRKFGVFGYGRIGGVVAGYAKALGMQVWVHGRPASLAKADADGHYACEDRSTFFSSCDVVSLHMRLVEATKSLITATDLAKMKSDAILVNTSRSGLIATGALEQAIALGRPGYCAVDVFTDEPVKAPVPSWLQHPRVIATPHIGYVTAQEYDMQFADIFAQILAYAQGKPIHVINPEVALHSRQKSP
jgi:D-3-phosphoglycerate dehydrogenase / 2-oxoglutarate reductase